MSRYGWSREQISPYSSSLGSGVPNVTDEDFSYITSEELEDATLGSSLPTRSQYNPRGRAAATAVPEDDVLVIKSKGATYPAHFPAYSIGDGKLRVKDVRERVGIMMDLSSRRTRRIRLLYKGRQLKEPAAPVRDYGVKNNSELMVVLPDTDIDDDSLASSGDGEEMVVVADDAGRGNAAGTDGQKKPRKGKNKKPRKDSDRGQNQNTSPRDSGSNLSIPSKQEQERPPRSPSPVKPATGPHAKLNEISSHFTVKLLPLCLQYTTSPPRDAKKREEEYLRLSETVLQQVILKLDEVEPNGDEEVRARRKELIRQAQDVLKGLDTARHS